MPRGAEVSIPKGFHPPTDFKSVSKAAWIDAAEEPTKLDLLVELTRLKLVTFYVQNRRSINWTKAP